MFNNIKFDIRNDRDEVSFGNLVDLVRNYEDRTSMSLPQYIKRCIVSSRLFMQDTVEDSPVMADLMSNLLNMNIGWILTALQMNSFVDSTRKIRDVLGVVATESMQPHMDIMAAMESLGTPRMIDSPLGGHDLAPIPQHAGGTQGSKVIDPHPKHNMVPSGRIIEVKFASPDGKKDGMTANLFVQIVPTAVSSSVAEQFMAVNFTPSMYHRFVQWTTGEISFFRDFLFQRDLLAKRRKALKTDKSGQLHDMLTRQGNALSNSLLKLAMVTPERQNIANSIFVFEKRSFDEYCHQHGCDFQRYSNRCKFFNRTFGAIVALIDTNYERVHLYFHGLEVEGKYSFDQMADASKSNKFDLKDIMSTYEKGHAPRY